MGWQMITTIPWPNGETGTAGGPSGYVFNFDKVPHILYADIDNRLVAARYSGSWIVASPTVDGSLPPGNGVICPARQFAQPNLSVNDESFAFYRGALANRPTDSPATRPANLFCVHFGPKYVGQPVLTTAQADTAPVIGGRPSAFLGPATVHSLYLGPSGSLNEVRSTNGFEWQLYPIATPRPASSDPVGLVFSDPFGIMISKHLFYVDADGHVRHLSGEIEGTWATDSDPTPIDEGAFDVKTERPNGPSSARAVGAISTWVINDAGGASTIHVVYRDRTGDIHELFARNDSGNANSMFWQHSNLTQSADGAIACAGTPIGYPFTSEQSEHVVYRGSDSKIHELYNALLSGNGWRYNAMTNQIDDLPDAIGDPYGYTWEAEGSEHIVFQRNAGPVYELHYTP